MGDDGKERTERVRARLDVAQARRHRIEETQRRVLERQRELGQLRKEVGAALLRLRQPDDANEDPLTTGRGVEVDD